MVFIVVVSMLDVWVVVLSTGMPLGLDKSGRVILDRVLINLIEAIEVCTCIWLFLVKRLSLR